MKINKNVKRWLLKADHDLKNAKIILRQPIQEILNITDTICFHCQQAIEKYLKGYLTFKGIEFSKTHDLNVLKELCCCIDKEFSTIEIHLLNEYSVEVRYPDDYFIPTLRETRYIYKISISIRKLVLSKLI